MALTEREPTADLPMWRSRGKRWRRAVRWFAPVTVLALAPKCFVCAAAYLGLGAALGLGGPEFCGASQASMPAWALSVVGTVSATLGVFVLWVRGRIHEGGPHR